MTPKSRLWKVRVLDADNRLRHVVFVHAPSRAFARSNAVEKIERLGISRARGWNWRITATPHHDFTATSHNESEATR